MFNSITRSIPSTINDTGRFNPIELKSRLICSEYDFTS